MKMENLHRTTKEKKEETEEEDEESEEEEEEEDDEKQPELETALIKHNGAINRIIVLKKLFIFMPPKFFL
jgi:ribosome assembly protein RRB1